MKKQFDLTGLERNGLWLINTEKACSNREVLGFATNAADLQYVQQRGAR